MNKQNELNRFVLIFPNVKLQETFSDASNVNIYTVALIFVNISSYK